MPDGRLLKILRRLGGPRPARRAVMGLGLPAVGTAAYYGLRPGLTWAGEQVGKGLERGAIGEFRKEPEYKKVEEALPAPEDIDYLSSLVSRLKGISPYAPPTLAGAGIGAAALGVPAVLSGLLSGGRRTGWLGRHPLLSILLGAGLGGLGGYAYKRFMAPQTKTSAYELGLQLASGSMKEASHEHNKRSA